MGEGQFELTEAGVEELNRLDALLDADVGDGTGERFAEHLTGMHALIREHGRPLRDDEILPSDCMVPPPDISLEELRSLLNEDGLIPG